MITLNDCMNIPEGQMYPGTAPTPPTWRDHPVSHYLDQMPRRYFNPGPGEMHDDLQHHLDLGRIVVNAPRPIGGEDQWKGSFLCGIFWAANAPTIDQVYHWYRYGATIVDLVTDADVEALAKAQYETRMETWPSALPHPGTWEEFVAGHGVKRAIATVDPMLPYRGV
jgi:hypothetical protein